MLAKKPSINVTFQQDIFSILTKLARMNNTSVANIVCKLTYEGLEYADDAFLSKLAKELDKSGEKSYSHDVAWVTH